MQEHYVPFFPLGNLSTPSKLLGFHRELLWRPLVVLEKGPQLCGDKRSEPGCEAPHAGRVLTLWASSQARAGTVPGLWPCLAGSLLASLGSDSGPGPAEGPPSSPPET